MDPKEVERTEVVGRAPPHEQRRGAERGKAAAAGAGHVGEGGGHRRGGGGGVPGVPKGGRVTSMTHGVSGGSGPPSTVLPGGCLRPHRRPRLSSGTSARARLQCPLPACTTSGQGAPPGSPSPATASRASCPPR